MQVKDGVHEVGAEAIDLFVFAEAQGGVEAAELVVCHVDDQGGCGKAEGLGYLQRLADQQPSNPMAPERRQDGHRIQVVFAFACLVIHLARTVARASGDQSEGLALELSVAGPVV